MSYNEYESYVFDQLSFFPSEIIRDNSDFYDRYDKEIEQNFKPNFDEFSNFIVSSIEVKDSEIKCDFILLNDSNKTNENIPSKENKITKIIPILKRRQTSVQTKMIQI